MPQLNLLNPGDQPVAISIQWEDRTPDLDPAWVSTIRLRKRDGDWYTFTSARWVGVMVDFAQTYSHDIMNAWMYGEPADLLAAHQRVHRAAKAHMKAHAAD